MVFFIPVKKKTVVSCSVRIIGRYRLRTRKVGDLVILILFLQLPACSNWQGIQYNDRYQRVRSEVQAGFSDYKEQNYESALRRYRSAEALLPADADPLVHADILYKIGRTNLKQQEYASAIEVFAQALEIQRQGSERDRAILNNMLGMAYRKVGDIDAAKEHLNAALALRYATGDVLGEARTLGNLAATYIAQGRYIKAIEQYHRAQQLFAETEGASAKDIGNVLTSLSSVYAEMGQYERALKIQRQALAVYEKAGNRAGISSAFHNIGYIEAEQGNYFVAADAFKTAIAERKKIHDRFGVAETTNNLGLVLSNMGQHERALAMLSKALQVLQELNTRKQLAATYDSIGTVYTRTGKFMPALEAYQQALLIWRATGDRESARMTLGNIGDVLAKSGRPTLAIVFYKLSINITEAIRDELRVLPEQEQKAYLNRVQGFYRSLADLLLQQDRVIEAQQVLDLLKIQEAANYIGPVRGNAASAGGISVLSPEREIERQYEALQQEAVIVGKALAELNKIDRNARTTAQNEQYGQLFARQQQLLRAFMEFIESDEITGLVTQLSRQVRSQMPALDQLRPLRDNLSRLGGHVVLLYPLVLDNRLEIVLATGLTPPLHVSVRVDHKELNQVVLDFRSDLTGRRGKVKDSAQALYKLLVEPVEPVLRGIGADTILYAPDGVLRYVPLAALYDGRQWLVERFRVNNITAFSLTDLNTEPVPKPKLLAAAFASGNFSFSVGDQAFEFKGLPYAGREVGSLAEMYADALVLVDRNFSPAAVVPELSNFNIVHLATHAALVPGRAYESFILFGDGDRVTVDQVKYEWMLSNVDLIVLSACETAMGAVAGAGEEILGLGFLMESAGARATLASLWPVDDGGTQKLMSEFYRVLKQPTATKAGALRQAQVAMLAGKLDSAVGETRGVGVDETAVAVGGPGSFRHPYYWAPFILIGNGL